MRDFDELTRLDGVLSMNQISELTLFGLGDGTAGVARLHEALRATERPRLQDLLGRRDVFVDLAIVRDRFLGLTSYFTVKARQPIDEALDVLVGAYHCAYAQYIECVAELRSFEEIAAALDLLLEAAPA